MNNRNYKTDSKLTISSNYYLLEEERLFLLREVKKVFQNKDEAVFIDTLFYNFLRNKPLFSGVERLRNDKYFVICSAPSFLIKESGREMWYLKLIEKFENKKFSRLASSYGSRRGIIK